MNLKITKIVFPFFILVSSFSFGQNNINLSPDKNFWLSPSLGLMKSSQYSGSKFDFSIVYSNKSDLYSIEFFYVTKFNTMKPFSESDENSLSGFNLLYGKINRFSFFKTTYSFGISFIRQSEIKIRNDLHAHSYDYTIGLPVSAEFILTPIRIFAIGLKGYGNLNIMNSTIGLNVAAYFGKVK